jgi:uncharacterized membrane protein (DUF106 family)
MRSTFPPLFTTSSQIIALFAWLISHQPTVFFSQNKPATSTLLSEQTSTSHQPPANRTGFIDHLVFYFKFD